MKTDNPVNPNAEPEAARGSGVRKYGMRPDHWLYAERPDDFPQVVIGATDANRDRVREAARYAIQGATDNGRILDFDPDAMVINFVNAICGTGSNLVSVQSLEPDLSSIEGAQGGPS